MFREFYQKLTSVSVHNSLKLNQNIIYLYVSISNRDLHQKKLVLSSSCLLYTSPSPRD